MGVESYRDLQVWQKAIDVVVDIYDLSKTFPDDERFELMSQIQRAAVSVAANIAEGHGRGSTKSFLQFLWIANGSLKEVETHLIIAGRLGYVTREQARPVFDELQEVDRMLTGLRRALKNSDPK